jgi:hypothetical protein
MLTASDPQGFPAANSEMTLSEALWMYGGGTRTTARPVATPRAMQTVDTAWYRSESELYDQWQRLGAAPGDADSRAVILVLGTFLQSSLRELLRMERPGGRLVIVPQPGHWPGSDSFGDLILRAQTQGWKSIELCRDLRDAPESFASISSADERPLLFLPTNPPADAGR